MADRMTNHGATAGGTASGSDGWRFFCVTFGCKVNQYETQAIREAWMAQGGVEVEKPGEAGLILINSCAITGRAERDARNALLRLQREAPAAVLVLTGCAARLVADFVPRRHAAKPRADCVIVQERKEELCQQKVVAELLEQVRSLSHETVSASSEPAPINIRALTCRSWPDLTIERYRRARPVLKVQDGCSHRCTYCIVPYTRGPHVSRDPMSVVAEAARLWDDHAELMISGVNLAQYGRDHTEYGSFWDLLERLDGELAPRFAGRRRLRISSLEPSQLDERGVSVLTKAALVAPHLHISLQHASSNVLRRMGRGHYMAQTLTDALAELAGHWPTMGLGADILVGFPGETVEDVDILCRFIEETPFTYSHVFPYSRRPGTPAAGFPDQLPKKEKAARAAAVRAVVAERARAFWERQRKETSFDLVLDAAEGNALPGYVHGVNAFYAPCYLSAESLAALPADAGHTEFLPVRPTGVCERGVLVELKLED